MIDCLTEGNSIRSTERLTGVHRDTIMRLMVRVGEACQDLMDREMRHLPLRRVQVDEIWTFVRKKQGHLGPQDDERTTGDFYTFVAIDPVSKLVPTFLVGKRDSDTAHAFMHDLSARLTNRIQLSSDHFGPYVEAVESAFVGEVDYGRLVKSYVAEPVGPGRYAPPRVASVDRERKVGSPDWTHISTSHVERGNLTMRTFMRRLTRLSLGFSKKLENLKAATALYFADYNYCKVHRTLRMPPAMAAGVSRKVWTVGDLVAMTDY